jgi:LPS-assembly lipoprotein
VTRPFLAFALLALAGCGFHPVYARRDATAPAVAGLSQIDVAIIPDRFGQLTREALQARLEQDGPGAVHRYRLVTSLGLSGDPIAVRPDTVPTRVRLIGSANWTLTAEDASGATLAHGTARDVDGFDIIDQQYFAADMQNEEVQRRMAAALADQIALQLALYFEKHPPPPT